MTNGPNVFLVDSNILVYAYDPSEGPKRDRAIEILDRLGIGLSGALSVQVLGEFFNTITKKIPSPLSADEAERTVMRFAETWVVHDLTGPIVLEAVRAGRRHQLSYWDSLIWATARLYGCAYILSEDLNDGQVIEGVTIQNPLRDQFDLAVLG